METKQRNPIIAEVREIRDRFAAGLDYDVGAIFRKLRERQDKSGRDYLSYAPRPIIEGSDDHWP